MPVQLLTVPGKHGESATVVVEKRLSTRTRGESESQARLRDEGFLLRALGGRFTPRFVEAGEDAQGPWVRMERIAAPTVAARLATIIELERLAARIEPGWVTRACVASFAALADLHEAGDKDGPLGIVHADISPANLIVDDAGTRAVLLDLELASWRRSAPRDGSFRGSVHYCAPEIARGEAPVCASDLFALAAVLMHAATGLLPRDGPSLAAVLAAAAEQPLLEAPHVASAALPKAVLRCLAHDAVGRPASAREVLALLAVC